MHFHTARIDASVPHLARREIIAGIEALAAAIPPFKIRPGALINAHGGGVFSLDSLPLVW